MRMNGSLVFFIGACIVAFGAAVQAAQVDIFPGVASVAGQNGTAWRSEILLHNGSSSAQNVLLEIIPRGGTGVLASKTIALAPGKGLRLADLYATLQAPSGAGALRMTGDVNTWVRTFNQGIQGTFGQNIPSASDTRYEIDETALFPIHTPASLQSEFRSNLILLSLDAAPQTVRVRVGDRERAFELQPGVFSQIDNVGSWVGAVPGDATLAVVSNGIWAGYVSSIDPVTGDPTTFIGARWPDHLFYEPFDTLAAWSYSTASSVGASFLVHGGLLTVGSFGTGGSWPGPSVQARLTHPFDASLQDFSLDTMLNATVGGFGDAYRVIVLLLDGDDVPFVGFAWDGNSGRFELHADGSTESAGEPYVYTSVAGKVSVRKEGGTYSIHYNDGPSLADLPQLSNKVATSVQVTMQRYETESSSVQIAVDWIRLERR